MIHPFNSRESLGIAMTVFGRSVKGTFHFPSHVEYDTNYADTGAFSDTDRAQSPDRGELYTLIRTHHLTSNVKGDESEKT